MSKTLMFSTADGTLGLTLNVADGNTAVMESVGIFTTDFGGNDVVLAGSADRSATEHVAEFALSRAVKSAGSVANWPHPRERVDAGKATLHRRGEDEAQLVIEANLTAGQGPQPSPPAPAATATLTLYRLT